MSFTVYAVFKDLEYKLETFKTYRAARKSVEVMSKKGMLIKGYRGFKIIERVSTYNKVYDSRESGDTPNSIIQ